MRKKGGVSGRLSYRARAESLTLSALAHAISLVSGLAGAAHARRIDLAHATATGTGRPSGLSAGALWLRARALCRGLGRTACVAAATDRGGPSANRSGCPPADCAAAAEQERQARRRFLRRYGLGEARAPLLWLHRDRWSEPFSLAPDG